MSEACSKRDEGEVREQRESVITLLRVTNDSMRLGRHKPTAHAIEDHFRAVCAARGGRPSP